MLKPTGEVKEVLVGRLAQLKAALQFATKADGISFERQLRRPEGQCVGMHIVTPGVRR